MCRFNKDGLSNALLHTLQGKSVRSLGLALGVGPPVSIISPCELAAELSPETDFPSSSADGGDPDSALDNNDIDKSSGESIREIIIQYKLSIKSSVVLKMKMNYVSVINRSFRMSN